MTKKFEFEILNGNELIVQGGMEAGFSLYTGYPGSPLADFFNILYHKREALQEKGIKVVLANSEANAAAMASGAKQAGRHCLLAMKSMGLNVAADALSVGNFANPGPKGTGVVVVVGDDPWSLSTSAPVDSRYLYKHLHIPFLEPSTPQELKDWIGKALHISQESSVYQGVLLTTFMAEGGGRVEIAPEAVVEKEAVEVETAGFDLSKNVMVPPNSLKADIAMIQKRFPKVKRAYRDLALDQIFGHRPAKVGFLSAGGVFETLRQVLHDCNALGHFSLYKLASSYPLVDEVLLPYLKGLQTLVVVEEKRGFLEGEIKELCQRHGLAIPIFGKTFAEGQEGFPAHGGLDYALIRRKVEEAAVGGLPKGPQGPLSPSSSSSLPLSLPRRLPTFCPGCPHRETLSLLKELRQVLKEEKVDLVSHGDVGCYSLSFLEPFKEMHNLSAMGQGGALGAGMDIFTKNPSIVLMGDSTFFHSGMTDVSNSVQLGHDITYILLDNDNTAMTGHQMTPRTGVSVEGLPRPRQNIREVAQSLGVAQALDVNPSDRYFYKNKLLEFIRSPGVKVIVSNKECALTFHGRKKNLERQRLARGESLPVRHFYQINTSVCEDCLKCVEMTGCPGLTQTFDAYGSKVAIDPHICVADSYCTKLKACPSFELVKVLDYHPTQYQHHHHRPATASELSDLPEPRPIKGLDEIAKGKDWRMVVTGVGGSGVTTISRVIARAALEMEGRRDLDFKFVDQKGLAQRNGNVTGHLAVFKKGQSASPITPTGTADLLLSPDLLDGSQHIAFLGPQGLALFNDEYQVPLSILLDRGEERPPLTEEKMRTLIQEKLGDRLRLFSMKKLCTLAQGSSVTISAMCLGVAFQSGRLPFSSSALEKALEDTVRPEDREVNLQAFRLGRELFLKGNEAVISSFTLSSSSGTASSTSNAVKLFRRSVREALLPWQNKTVLISLFERDVQRLGKLFPQCPLHHVAHYIHDLTIYNHNAQREDFFSHARELSTAYNTSEEDKHTALRVLVRSYFIKDEIFISHIMLSPVQRKANESLYGKWGKGFRITHINRPSFDIGPWKWEFDFSPRDWMLKLMRHGRFLRFILPTWHRREREINRRIRHDLLKAIPQMEEGRRRKSLKVLENVKGYRAIRYENAEGLHS